MAGDPNSGARSPAVQQALSVVDLGLQAATAYKRPDLVDRLRATQRRLADPAFHVFVVGEFKQGKSSLVNALLNAPVCPVDDDIATSVPTAIGYAEQPRAAVQFRAPESEDPDADDREPVRQDIPVDQIAQYVTEATNPANQQRVASVEVSLPRKLLADGLVIVDTPGVGGLGSAHSAATIGALPMADAVIFVTDASQEFTAPELDFLKMARRMCPNIICVLTKTDFYPSWRKIRDLDVAHLERAGIKAKLITVSSALRIHALRKNDRNLNQESGFPALVGYLQNDIAANAETLTLRNATNDLVSVCGLIESQFRSERDALTDPERARALVENLTEVKERANRLRSGVSKWQQTLNDGITDLQGDLDYELRGRIRQVTKQADESIEATDPADAWDEFQAWLYRRVAEDVIATYASLHAKGRELAMRVNEHFGEDGGEVAINLAVMNPSQMLGSLGNAADVDGNNLGMTQQTLTALRSSYGGVMMFGMLARTAGLAMMNPATIVLGLFMGRSAMKSEKERALAQRRGQAKQAHRKYTDEVAFVVGKDAKDTLRRVQRQLRDFFSTRADELHRSTTEALNAAQKAVKSDEATRGSRLKDVEAELVRIGRLRKRAMEIEAKAGQAGQGAGQAGHGQAAPQQRGGGRA